MITRIEVLKDIPGICKAGEYDIPTERIDEKFAGVLAHKGLAKVLDYHAVLGPVEKPPGKAKKKGR